MYKNTKAICQKKQLRGLIKSYQDVSNQPLPKNMVRLRSENQWLSPVPGSHGGCQMLEGQELPFLRRLHLQQVADQTVFEDSAEAEELHVEQVAWGNRCHTVDGCVMHQFIVIYRVSAQGGTGFLPSTVCGHGHECGIQLALAGDKH